ncbi:MAG: hypothetical protein NC181_02180 [Clostridium sp.]|nr:hypothetical protein [Clostridium sp.]MCM1443692.1 hypothetical protein [Candidatus Amulumruptor caecigallinarius]
MEQVMEFINDNYILILAIILVLLFMVLGYFVDKKKLLKGKVKIAKKDNKSEEKNSIVENNEQIFDDIKETDLINEEPVLTKELEENATQEVQDVVQEDAELDVSFQEIENPRKKNHKFEGEKYIEPEISVDSSIQNDIDSKTGIKADSDNDIELEQPVQEMEIKEDISNINEIDQQEDLLKTQDLEQVLEKNAIVKEEDLYSTMDLTTEFGPINTSIKDISQNEDLNETKAQDNSSEDMEELEEKEKALLEKYNNISVEEKDDISKKEDLKIEETPTIDFSNASNKAIPVAEHDKLYSKVKIRNLEDDVILDTVNSAIQQEQKAKLDETPIQNDTSISETVPAEQNENKVDIVNDNLESIMDIDKGFDKIYNPDNSSSNFTYEISLQNNDDISQNEILSSKEDDSNDVVVPPDLYKNIKNIDLKEEEDISIESDKNSKQEDVNYEKSLIEQLKDLELPSMDSLDKINQKLNDNLEDDIWKF